MEIQEFSYDGIVFPFCSVAYGGRAEYDPTGKILQGWSITFRGTTTISASSAGISGSGGSSGTTSTFAVNLYRVLDILAHPRRRLKLKHGGTTIFDIAPAGGSQGDGGYQFIERRWGPKPRVLNCNKHIGGLSATVTFEIECFVFPCSSNPTGNTESTVLSDLETFYWQYRYSFDRNFVCTRTITGQYRTRSPINPAAEFLPNGPFFPPLPTQFFRESINHSLSADGLTLDWTVVDKQRWRTLPKPLTDGSATMRVMQQGAMIRKSFSCHFEAPLDVDKKVILQFVTAMIWARFADAFSVLGSGGGGNEFITSCEFTNSEFDNRIDATVTSQRAAKNVITASGDEDNAAKFFASVFGDVKDIGSASAGPEGWTASDGYSELRSMLGTAGLVPVPSALFDVCNGSAGHAGGFTVSPTSETYTGSATSPGSRTTVAAEDFTDDESSPEENFFSDDHRNFPYTAFTESWQFILDNNLVLLPVTSTATGSGGSTIPDIIQQTSSPNLRIIQIGHARRLGAPVDIPQPPFVNDGSDGAQARVAKRSPRSNSVRILPGGQLEYSLDWTCEVIVPNVKNIVGLGETPADDETLINIPINPQLDETYFQSAVHDTVEPVQSSPERDGQFQHDTNYYS